MRRNKFVAGCNSIQTWSPLVHRSDCYCIVARGFDCIERTRSGMNRYTESGTLASHMPCRKRVRPVDYCRDSGNAVCHAVISRHRWDLAWNSPYNTEELGDERPRCPTWVGCLTIASAGIYVQRTPQVSNYRRIHRGKSPIRCRVAQGWRALGDISQPTDPDLGLLIDRLPKLPDTTRQALLIALLKASWPTLRDTTRQAILALVEQSR